MYSQIWNNIGMSESTLFSMLSELFCTNGGIIKIPAEAEYSLEDTIAVINYAATSTSNSMEAAVTELKRKMPDATIPSADTIFNYINVLITISISFMPINGAIIPPSP
ncbi:MAG: hypothetical protein WAV32_09510 [Halobacteriota archaeon]